MGVGKEVRWAGGRGGGTGDGSNPHLDPAKVPSLKPQTDTTAVQNTNCCVVCRENGGKGKDGTVVDSNKKPPGSKLGWVHFCN